MCVCVSNKITVKENLCTFVCMWCIPVQFGSPCAHNRTLKRNIHCSELTRILFPDVWREKKKKKKSTELK